MPELSIVLPTYNGARYLAPQLRSILDQTAGDFELLVLDDGSTDATVALVADWAARDPRIRLLDGHGNRGQRTRLAELFAVARGRFVAVADQDDIWALDRNERLLAAIGDRPIAFGRSDLIDGDGRDLGRTLLDAVGSSPDTRRRLRTFFNPLLSAHGMIVRRDWLNPAAFHARMPFDWMIALEALFTGGIAYVDAAVVKHRIHGGNQCNGSATDEVTRRSLSRHHIVQSFSHLRPTRLLFWSNLAELGRSPVLDPALRRDLTALADECFGAWFSSWRNLKPLNPALRSRLHAVLDGWAGSDEDLAAFRVKTDLITRSAAHPRNVRAGWRAVRGGLAY